MSADAPQPQQEQTTAITCADFLSMELGINKQSLVSVIKATCFKGVRPENVSNEMLAAFMNVAMEIRKRAPSFNPLLPGMLYAYPGKNGCIEAMIGPDGTFAMLSCHPDIHNWETECEYDGNGKLFACVARIKMTSGAVHSKRVILSEWYIGTNPNWQTRPTHMLEIRAIKQCARQVVHGMPMDEDELKLKQAIETGYIENKSAADKPANAIKAMIEGRTPASAKQAQKQEPAPEQKTEPAPPPATKQKKEREREREKGTAKKPKPSEFPATFPATEPTQQQQETANTGVDGADDQTSEPSPDEYDQNPHEDMFPGYEKNNEE